MRRHREDNRLSSGDALFLYLEREGMPLNVASVAVFEGEISLRNCTRFIESKLPLIPRYRQRVVAPPFNIGFPTWEYDPRFDVRHHVHHIMLKRGTDTEFKAVAGNILSKVMDRERPLWDFTLIHGLKGNRTGVVTRMHHCLADGLAGVSLMNVLMDPSPEVRPLPKRKPQFQAPPNAATPAFLDELLNSSVLVAEKVLSAQMELFQVLQQVLAAAGQPSERAPLVTNGAAQVPSVDRFARFMPELTAATQPLPFNVICRGPQRFGWAEIPLDDIKAVKNAFAVTVNDVALALVASAFQHYAELRGVRIKGRLLRIVVPVNVRGNDKAGDLGNRITFVPVTIPLDIRSPRKLVAAIHERTMFLKSVHVAECVGLFGTLLGTIPTAAQELAGPIVSQVPLGLCNFIFTNVPGPTSALYLLGHKMLHCYPYVPIGGDLGINCAVLTYNGTAYFGLTADVHAAPDVRRLEKFLHACFVKLSRAAGCRPPRKKRPRTGKHVVRSTSVEPQPAPKLDLPSSQPAISVQPPPVHAPLTNTHEENALLPAVGV